MADHSISDDNEEQGAWARPVSARLAGLFAGIAFLAAGAFFAGMALLLPFGRVGLPGPGFFPFALGVALGLLALAILFYAWRERSDGPPLFIGHRDVLIAIAGLVGIAFVFERMDSYLALGAFSALMILFLARASLWRVALGTVLGMLAVWLFFGLSLGLRLPTGDLWSAMSELVTTTLPFRQP